MLKSLTLITAVSLMLAGCANTARSVEPADRIGSNGFLVVHREGLPARDGMPAIAAAPWSSTQFLDLKDLEAMCHRQVDPQLPAATSQVAQMGLKIGLPTAVGGAIGTGLGAIAAFTGVHFLDYAKYGGLAAFGSGFGSGVGAGANQAQIAKNYAYYACEQWATSDIQKAGNGRLSGIGILPYAGVGHPKGIQKPTGPAVANEGAKYEQEDSAPPPPPPG